LTAILRSAAFASGERGRQTANTPFLKRPGNRHLQVLVFDAGQIGLHLESVFGLSLVDFGTGAERRASPGSERSPRASKRGTFWRP
jgi:hypothetical protein